MNQRIHLESCYNNPQARWWISHGTEDKGKEWVFAINSSSNDFCETLTKPCFRFWLVSSTKGLSNKFPYYLSVGLLATFFDDYMFLKNH